MKRDIHTYDPLDLATPNERVIVFLPNTNELQRFIFSGAFSILQDSFNIHYVLPKTVSQQIFSSTDILHAGNTTFLDIPSQRFSVWKSLFEASCIYLAPRSPSFAIRANLLIAERKLKFIRGIFDWMKNKNLLLKSLQKKFNNLIIFCERYSIKDVFFKFAKKKKYFFFIEQELNALGPSSEIIGLINRINPYFCVIPSSLLDIFCNDVVWACEVEQIGCLVLQSGWDNMSSKGVLVHKSPLVGVWGPQSILHGKFIQEIPGTSMRALGSPHYEFLRPASDKTRQEFRKKLGLSDQQTIILFGGSFRQFDETGTLQQLDQAIDSGELGDIKIIYRPHPWRATRTAEAHFFDLQWKHVIFDPDMQERYVREHQKPGYIKHNVPMFDMIYLANLISSVDAVISPMSTLLLESMILQRPTMAIAFGDGKHAHNPSVTSKMTHFKEMLSSDALIWCNDSNHLIANCRRLVSEGLTKKISDAQKNLLSQIVCLQPGNYASRLADFVHETVLPHSRKLRGIRTGRLRTTISHAYGAHIIAQRYCGLSDPSLVVPDYWMHGWIPSYHNKHYAFIALHKKNGQDDKYDFTAQIANDKKNITQFVSRKDQAAYLVDHGYKHVRAIGLPFVYLPKPRIRRVPRSLLVLPPHSHKTHGPGDSIADNYAQEIAFLRPHFEHIYVGLNEDDLTKNQWVHAFRKQNINVFCTTDQGDPNTLSKLSSILHKFEFVTTNGYGSHIALAAYCGAKVSIYGTFADFPYERIKSTHSVKMFPKLQELSYSLCTGEALREHYPFLFTEPHKASVLTEWGAREVGDDCLLTPEELAQAFGWDRSSKIKI
jgi:hypothetical protein